MAAPPSARDTSGGARQTRGDPRAPVWRCTSSVYVPSSWRGARRSCRAAFCTRACVRAPGGGFRASCARLACGHASVHLRANAVCSGTAPTAGARRQRTAPLDPARTTDHPAGCFTPVPVRARRHRRYRFCRRQRTASTPQAQKKRRPPRPAARALGRGPVGEGRLKRAPFSAFLTCGSRIFAGGRRVSRRFTVFSRRTPSRARAGGLFALQSASGGPGTALFPFGATWCGASSAARPRP